MKGAAVLLLIVGSSSPLLAQQDYEIRLNRSLKPGNQFKVFARGRILEDFQISLAHEPLQETKDDFEVEYAATRKVLEVDKAGRATKVSDIIEQLSVIRAGNHAELAQRGASLVAFVQGKKKIFEIDGQRVDDQTEKALKVVIDITTGGPSDDEVFGTRARKKLGESWNMNKILAVEDFAKRSNVELRNLAGEVRLESVTHESTGDVLKIVCHFKGDARPVSLTTITSSRGPFEATWSTRVPVEPSLARTEDSIALSLQFQGKGGAPDHTQTSVAGTLRKSVICKMTPLND
ncbi:MAG: hypothetical protein QOH39_232 [Verrucomicrobiota bacterium]|jgi:hypothetical protein